MNEIKPGWKTTEFWLSVIAAIVGLLFASDAIPTDSPIAKALGGVATALSAMGYSVARGMAKKSAQLLLCTLIALPFLAGCANLRTTQIDESFSNGQLTRRISTKIGTLNYFQSKAEVNKLNITTSDKILSTKIGNAGATADVINTNSVAIMEALGKGVAAGLTGK